MKATMHFDTLTYANKLKAAGMDPKLAEVQALALVEALDDGLATKMNIAEVRSEIAEVKSEMAEVRTEIAQLKTELKTEIAEVRTEMAKLKSELIQWMVGLFITNITLVGGFIAFAQYLSHLK